MIPDELRGVVAENPDVQGGVICFVGTRIPIQVLFDNQGANVPLTSFLDAHPDLTSEQVQAVINWGRSSVAWKRRPGSP